MTFYDPIAYWQAAGADPDNPEHESHFVRTPVFARQEETLMATLESLVVADALPHGRTFGSILEVGCGWGRVTKLVHDRWPDLPYVAIDLSRARLTSARRKAPNVTFRQSTIADYGKDSAALFEGVARIAAAPRRFDLVLAVETLMHVPPDEIKEAIEKLCDLSSHYVVSLDWTADLGTKPIAPWNARHPYAELYGDRLVSETPTDLQAVFVADVTAGRADSGPVADADRRRR